ncbi:hypothetical protein PG997_012860 [Apiospora hydei]|uniref:DUF4211 domain-containing protein n=1 Tax=Apiospora hydei TaxID=1337664 RepID=A0ABR1V4L4_9PEZI
MRTGKGKASASQPAASFMPRFAGSQRRAPVDSSDEEAAAEGVVLHDSSGDEDELPSLENIPPPRSSQSVSTRLKRTVLSDDDDEEEEDDEDDQPIPPSSSRRRAPVINLDSNEGSEDEDDDVPVPPSSSRRRARMINLDSDEDDELVVLSPAKRRKIGHSSQRRRSSSGGSSSDDHPSPSKSPTKSARKLVAKKGRLSQHPASSPTKRPKGHRSDKQKKMELLRRRRAGEKIDQLTSSESEDDGEKRGLYDTDSDEGMQALKEFDDDDEEVDVEAEIPQPSKKSKKFKKSKSAKKAREQGSDEEKDSDMDSFIESDEDGPLGAPDIAIPLEFTAQATMPLKDQFPYVVEWLVHNRINPRFGREDPIYANAWRKLDDEVRGLASSKFTSSAWKPEFYRTLRGRPKIDTYEMDAGDAGKYETCEACGRSGHPATWRIEFQGSPYRKETLDEIESDSDSDSDEDDDHASVDSQGNSLPPTNKQWVVGSTCCSNAETAHSLLHWKYALKEWVEDRLERDGWMKPDKLKEREKLKHKKRNKLANKIVDSWRESGVVKALYGDFKQNLENARNKTTTGRGRWR